VTKKGGSSVVGKKSPTGKTYTVTLARAKGRGQTVVISAPGKVLEANTTLETGKIVTLKLSRSKLVGKYPEVHHLPAPQTKLKLDDETRKSLLASMVLI